MPNIHPTAIVEDGAKIAQGVQIGAFSRITSKVHIAKGTIIDSGVLIDGDTQIGEDNHIFSHAVVGSIPQDMKYNGEDTKLIIGNNNTIREFTLINPGTIQGGGITKIGNNNLLMGYVHIGHDIIIGDHCIIANATNIGGHVELGNRVVVGAMSAIHQFVKIGDYAMLAGASALTQDLPPYCMAEGNRAYLRGLNLTGLRRHLESSDINELKNVYKRLFEQNKSLQETSSDIISEDISIHTTNMASFIKDTKRGIPFKRAIGDV